VLVFQVEPRVRRVEHGTYEHVFRVATGCCYRLADGEVQDKETVVLRNSQEWRQWIIAHRSPRRCTWIYSYGLVYGLTLLDAWRGWSRDGEQVVSAVLSDPPSIVLTRRSRCVSKYVDAANYARDGLRTLARAAGTPCPSPMSCGSTDDAVIAYSTFKTCTVGDLICQWISLVRSRRLCGWQPTATQLSFASLRHSFLAGPIAIHAHVEATSLERAALHGGRVQMWRSGCVGEPVTIVDVNSLYPAVMRDYPHPVKFRSHQWGGTVRELAQALSGYECVAAVGIAQSRLDLPRRVGRAVYWDGVQGVRYLAGAELRQASALGCVKRVHALARYDAGFPFTRFVDGLFPLKVSLIKEKKYGQAALVKMLLNGLHGKFAQHGRRWQDCPAALSQGIWTTWWGRDSTDGAVVPCRDVGGCTQRCTQAGEWRHSFPGLSASIASAARVVLARARDVAGVAQTLYCDTDSLHLIGDGPDRMATGDLLHPADLGKWKVAATGSDAHYWGLKHYRVGSKYCCCYLTASAWGIADGVYRDAARIHFGRLLDEGLHDAVYYRERIVRTRERDQGERMEVIDYGDFA